MTWGLFTTWILPGLWVTVQVTIFSAALAFAVSLAIGTLRTSRWWIVRFLSGAYFEIFRGTSALVMLFWFAFAFPLMFGYQLVPMWAGVLALGLTYGAYGSEIVRGALAAVPVAQREAGIALSFTPMQRLRRVEFPQAWPEMVAPLNALAIELLKGTALVSVISVSDLAFAGNVIRLSTGDNAPVYTLLLVMYFILAFAITRGMRVVERQAKKGIGQEPERVPLFRKRGAGSPGAAGDTRAMGGVNA
ncbi:ectoine/hydroxyectoine ABC transporter permease subunit EhuC [Streptomyces alkaliphilus]|uniref:Ectoine/hydroxyectoine ABC transporter permease subunit EhuC n=1 Tax=Streptomyces alkaliphilus TaxID=1472722 RepID=A0A7W3TDY7_9ACTN|nr:ectoine/hydroxyectoine ABC transporter permease subunit EhuC [Streptomyces alkaliphilus]MBB0245104.1 ectoine/hydroxyectoine ABC transporter permease subunit EhuC [Streptomyces alkaliphilus]MQS06497.1 ectoine/hydroxyectoine ABC transporter permease subunit EhuC [Streptomyces alkaliphilus]